MSINADPGSAGRLAVESMRELRTAYLDKVRELERNRKLGEGIFGLKGGPADDPCHERFAEETSALLTTFSGQEPDAESIRLVLEELYAPPQKSAVPQSAYWMLIAVQGLCPELIDGLSKEDARALADRYAAAYRRWERFPVQEKILKALKNRARNL